MRWCLVLGLVLLVGLLAAWLPGWSLSTPTPALAAATGADISDFMVVVHGPKGLLIQIRESMSGDGPADDKAWKAVRARASVVNWLIDTILLKNQPRRGDKNSWKEKVMAYKGDASAMLKSAASKDASGTRTALGKLTKGCDNCHKAHR